MASEDRDTPTQVAATIVARSKNNVFGAIVARRQLATARFDCAIVKTGEGERLDPLRTLDPQIRLLQQLWVSVDPVGHGSTSWLSR